MRWVWRAESGAFKLEYAGLVLLVAAVAAAVIGFGLPTQVSSGVESAVCTALDREDCEPGQGDGSSGEDPDGGQDSDGTDPGDGESPEGESPDGEEDGEGEEEDVPVEEEGDSFDWDELNADYADYEDAQRDLWDAEADQSAAEEEYGDLDEELLNLLSELIGLEDAKKCFLEGDIGACLMTLITALPWGKLLKVGSKIPKMWRLFDRWRSARRAKNAADEAVDGARSRLDDAAAACLVPNSFEAGTPVLLGDGDRVPIEQVRVGDLVVASDPVTGRTASRHVTATIDGVGRRDMVEVGLAGGGGSIRVTAGHPFWEKDEDDWVSAEDLRVGDRLTSSAGADVVVGSLRHYDQEDEVFNLTVAGFHTYHVSGGGSDVLVHNSSRRCPTKTDRIKEHLTERDLDAARRELDGEVVARKPDGTPWDHVNEVREAQQGLRNRIQQIQRRLGDSRVTDAERTELEEELSEASRLLDHSEGFVPPQ
ncbi:Flp pilus assembly pilin Flp [Spinactinospora alkalitolerans]|uniref:Flp pilus assembly pilin Flp n=1 Tax=Spinactinospora alkalitolerans TaxID=687207 RepID=A0A852U526_9ACTN|nr:polymorphic toxin type 28 domain-containing protein [Spinactinospora alkalitolerans]NYE49184.1 Flp pilus assembly pilin Flp [Spinactinospora alkalitolerans]